MTPEEKAALDWLDCAEIGGPACRDEDERARTAIKALLARPVLPQEPSAEALRVMRVKCEAEGFSPDHTAYQCYRALYAHLTAPKTKEVEVWFFEWDYRGVPGGHHEYSCPEACLRHLKSTLPLEHYGNRRVTGPHKQKVPA